MLLRSLDSNGQLSGQAPLVSLDLHQASIHELAQSLEKQSGWRIFYDSTKFDSSRFDLNLQERPLTEALKMAFANTDFHFSADAYHHVFITKGITLQPELPEDFFGNTALAKKDSSQKAAEEEFDENVKSKDTAVQANKLLVFGQKSAAHPNQRVTISGYVKDAATGEPVNGATVYVEDLKTGAAADQFGYYTLNIPQGRHIISIQSIEMKDTRREVVIYKDAHMNVDMRKQIATLKRVVISASKVANLRNVQMGVQKIDIKTIKTLPVLFGEADIMKAVLTMPGVQTVSEASTGLNVRGGSTDQNLILFNGATIYNPSHFFGMFSAFDPEVVKDVELYKSSIPAKYGGRLSSVLEVNTREGNQKEYTGSAGIGPLTSRLNIEGPIQKDKSSFVFGARTTYADWLLALLPAQYKNSKASFYDLNLDISQQIGRKDNLYFTGYLSNDRFNLNNDTTYGYGNRNIAVKWKHSFSNSLYSVLSIGYDRYQYSISSNQDSLTAYKFSFDINQYYFRLHFNHYLSSKHTLEYGINSLYYKLHPGNYEPEGETSLVVPQVIQAEQALESAVYLSDKYTLSDDFSLEAGIRYSVYNYLGPQQINNYAPGLPRSVDNITDTSYYASGKIIKTYQGPEYRLSARYLLGNDYSLKAGFNTQRQYIHMLSNTAAMAPTDIWKLSDTYIRPVLGDQYSLGLYKNLKSNTMETSLEVYYKNILDNLDYKNGAQLVLNPHIETDVLNTKGKAYGVEFQIKKTEGKLTGWISYTYSRVFLKQDDSYAGQLINNGNYYPADYDIPNDLVLVGNYKISHRFSFSFNGIYSTGRPITLPIGQYYYAGSERALYSDRNAYRIPDYFRTDFSIFIDGNHRIKQKQRTHNSWSLGVYNLTGRKNPYSVYYVSQNGVVTGYKLSIFGSAIPFINFNIRF
jgi:hypothetical protein